MPTRYRGVIQREPAGPVIAYVPDPQAGIGVYLAVEIGEVLAEKNEEIGALQEQLAAEKIEGGRLRGELAARDEAFRTAQMQISFYAETLNAREKEFRVLPITGIFHADALDPDERVELAEDRPKARLAWGIEARAELDALDYYLTATGPIVPSREKVTLYAPATLAEPPYLWKRVVRGSRDEEVHRRAGWQEARDSDALKHEPGQIPPSRSDWEGHEAAMLRKRGVGDQIIAAAKRMDVEQGGLRLFSLEEVTAQLLTISDGVDVRLDMLDEDVERLKGRGTVAAALDAAILDRVQALEARCPGQEERICKLEAELGDILSVWPGVVARCIGLEDGETKLKERLAALEIGVWKAEGRLCTLESQSKHSTT